MDNRCFINISCYIEVNTPSFSLKKLLIFVYSNLLKHECKMKNVLCAGAIATSMIAMPQLLFAAQTEEHQRKEKPNVLFLFVDDL